MRSSHFKNSIGVFNLSFYHFKIVFCSYLFYNLRETNAREAHRINLVQLCLVAVVVVVVVVLVQLGYSLSFVVTDLFHSCYPLCFCFYHLFSSFDIKLNADNYKCI